MKFHIGLSCSYIFFFLRVWHKCFFGEVLKLLVMISKVFVFSRGRIWWDRLNFSSNLKEVNTLYKKPLTPRHAQTSTLCYNSAEFPNRFWRKMREEIETKTDQERQGGRERLDLGCRAGFQNRESISWSNGIILHMAVPASAPFACPSPFPLFPPFAFRFVFSYTVCVFYSVFAAASVYLSVSI